MPIHLAGTKAPARNQRSVTTPGASLQFSANVGSAEVKEVPGLIVNARQIQDAAPKDLSLTEAQLSAITSLPTLTATVNDVFSANRDYLEATATEGKNAALGTAGSRKRAFFDSIRESLTRTGLSSEDSPAAQRRVTQLEEATYIDRVIEFDTAKLDSYHPYLQPFDKGVRKLEAIAPAGIERDNITAELDYITDRKTQKCWGGVNERDAEKTLGLRPIDRGNNHQTISLARSSSNPQRPEYVVITLNQDGLPPEFAAHAGEAVFRNGESLYFDQSNTPVPAALASHLTEKPASNKLGLRALKPTEEARANFPYDWNQNHSIDPDPIDTSWWGHCHIEALLASLSVKAGSEVTVFDARSKAVQTFGDTDVNDLLFAMLDTTGYAEVGTSRGAAAGKTTFVGNRNYTTESGRPEHKLILKMSAGERPFALRVVDLYDLKDSDERIEEEEVFSPTIAATDKLYFTKNPEFLGLRDNDWSTISGERKIVAEVEHKTIGKSGAVQTQVTPITLDPANPSLEPVLLGSTLGGGTYPPNVTHYYLNETTGALLRETFHAVKQVDGTYGMVPTSGETTVVGEVTGRILSKELVRESIVEMHNHALYAARRGLPFVTDKSSGHAVWNHHTDAITLTQWDQEGDFAGYHLSLQTGGGVKEWAYILQYDPSGKAIDAHAVQDPADFLWDPEREVSAPLYRGADGKLLFNASAKERGFLLDADGRIRPEGMSFFRYASDVIYASLNAPDKERRYAVIDAEGELYFYDDVEAYQADTLALGGDAEAVTAAISESPSLAAAASEESPPAWHENIFQEGFLSFNPPF